MVANKKLLFQVATLLLILFIFTACSNSVKITRGKLIGADRRVDWSETKGYQAKLLIEDTNPSPQNPLVTFKLVKFLKHPVYKVNKYEKLKSESMTTSIGMVGGLLGALVGSLITEGESSGDTLLSMTKGSLIGYGIGALFGSIFYGSPSRAGEIEEDTYEIIDYEVGTESSPLPGEYVEIGISEKEKWVKRKSNHEGLVSVNLLTDFGLYESAESEYYTIWASYQHTRIDVTLDPSNWLVPYFRITKSRDNIRRRPSAGSTVVARCRRGEVYRILNRQGNWYKIRFGTGEAWTHASNGEEFLGPLYRMEPGRPPRLEAEVAFWEPSGNRLLDAEETAKILLKVTNRGKGEAYDVTVRLLPETETRYMQFEKRKTLGVLPPGTTQEVEIPVTADYRIASRTNRWRVEVTEANGFNADPVKLVFESLEEQPPDLQLVDVAIDDDEQGMSFGNNNGRIELGESVEVTALITNRGKGKAEKVKAQLHLSGTNIFLGGKKNFDLGTLAPGEWKTVEFVLSLNKLYTGSESLPVTLDLRERRDRFDKTDIPLNLVLNKLVVGEQIVAITGRKPSVAPPPKLPDLGIDVDEVPQTGQQNPDAVAVVMGISKYAHSDVPRVDFAVRDATVIREYLVKMFGYRPENILFRTDDQATQAEFKKIFEGQLANYLQPDDSSDVFIYYSGHGAPDPESGEAFFVPYDCDPSYAKLMGYPLRQLYEQVSQLNARSITVVLDACFSGASERGPLLKQISPIFIEVENPLLLKENAVLFASSTGEQVSSWYPEKKHGLFTYFFLKGLKGEADTNSDGAITVQELGDYVRENVAYLARRLHGREQTPEVIGGNFEKVVVK